MSKIKEFYADHKEAIVSTAVAVSITAVAVAFATSKQCEVTEVWRGSNPDMPDKMFIRLSRRDGKSQLVSFDKPE